MGSCLPDNLNVVISIDEEIRQYGKCSPLTHILVAKKKESQRLVEIKEREKAGFLYLLHK